MINFARALCGFCRVAFVVLLSAALCGGAFAVGGGDKNPPLHLAARGGDIAEVKRLIDDGADIHGMDGIGVTPLHWAALEGQNEVIAILLKAGADVNAASDTGLTPLSWAAGKGRVDTIHALVKAGANVDAEDRFGFVPLHSAVGNEQTDGVSALIKAGENVNATSSRAGNLTPLHFSASGGYADIAAILMEAGADVLAEDFNGWGPLHNALINFHFHVAFVVLKEWIPAKLRSWRDALASL